MAAPNKKAELLQGTLEQLELRLLQSGEMNGWDIMQRIRLVSQDVLSVTPGALYPARHRLEERGLVAAGWGASDNNRRAKYYRLTKAGERQLKIETDAWQRVSVAITSALEAT